MNSIKNKTILFNNGEPVENITTAVVINGTPNLTPRAYNLLNILAKKLMSHILSTINIGNTILESIITVRALRDTNITVEEYMREIGINDLYLARDYLAQAGVELHSFFMSFYSSQEERISVSLKDTDKDESWNVGFLQNLMKEGKIYENNGSLELEFYPTFVGFLIKKYHSKDYMNLKAEDYTADKLLADLMLMGFTLIKDYGFEISGELLEQTDIMKEYVRTHYCLGPTPVN